MTHHRYNEGMEILDKERQDIDMAKRLNIAAFFVDPGVPVYLLYGSRDVGVSDYAARGTNRCIGWLYRS